MTGPDTRILSAGDAARKLRHWLGHPEAEVHIAGKQAGRLEKLIRLFEEAEVSQSDARIVPLERVLIHLFGEAELRATDVTANWRKFNQLLRSALEELECPLTIDFHKGKGPVTDRAIWVSETLSPVQRLTESINSSPSLLPPPNPRYDPARFIPQNALVPAAGRIFPQSAARHLEHCRGSSTWKEWPPEEQAGLRAMGASLRPVHTVVSGASLASDGLLAGSNGPGRPLARNDPAHWT